MFALAQDAEKVHQLRSRLESILNGGPGRLTHSAARTDVVLLIRRTVRPRGYASGAFIACGLAGRPF